MAADQDGNFMGFGPSCAEILKDVRNLTTKVNVNAYIPRFIDWSVSL
jgi:hypothetical protein